MHGRRPHRAAGDVQSKVARDSRAQHDRQRSGLHSVACPSSRQCTAVDDAGNEVTFNPASPGSPTPHQIAATRCRQWRARRAASAPPSTAPGIRSRSTRPRRAPRPRADRRGQHPTRRRVPVEQPMHRRRDRRQRGHLRPDLLCDPDPHPDRRQLGLNGVACPSTTQCTAVDANGQQVTFNPNSPGTPTPTTIDVSDLIGVACPSAVQCTAVDGFGKAVTFNPTSPGTDPHLDRRRQRPERGCVPDPCPVHRRRPRRAAGHVQPCRPGHPDPHHDRYRPQPERGCLPDPCPVHRRRRHRAAGDV